jgi:hypothetical protein
MNKIFLLVLVVFNLVSVVAHPSEAHLRDYLVNYGYSTTPQGAFEVEYYSDYDSDNSAFKSWKQQIEIEYGITHSLMASVYGVFKQAAGQPTNYDSTKVEMRYRFGDYGIWVVDPALYLEYVHPADPSNVAKVEAKLILSKDVGDWNFVSNLKFYERELSQTAKTEFGYTLGTSRMISSRASAGLELKGSLGDQDNFGIMSSNKHYIIPGIYVSVFENVRINIGAGFGLTLSSDDFSFKTIVEHEFM